ncbi:lysophospholipase Plb3 [Aspergillus heteromorphus CBS 117.55]|uniref:Lysophospholipase n=1 Tax=Aspergillus heteromorphus CBS 117.55 TaxID=1448321 RepID=A0A317WLZ6_9EURO|nr:lysophospholipase Plb3 [Aspergillus heteromorphus CBS 117.55]PWY87413.1 lysophospholipase Plb3 [Aspergillus heteromorphus CBS 117.55]
MKFPVLTAAAAGLASAASLPSSFQELEADVASVAARAVANYIQRDLPNAPDGYTPTNVTCPSPRPTIREANALSTNETDWLEIRRNVTLAPMKDLLTRLNLTGFDTTSYIDAHSSNISNIPNIAIAASGGGYRALTNGAGGLKAFDSRVTNTTNAGQLGGLLQSATYVAGLSGGSWLVGSMFVNNFSSIAELQASNKVWNFDKSLLEGPDYDDIQIVSTVEYWKDITEQVAGKADAGFNTSFTDYWGRALSYQLVNSSDEDGGPSYTWSSIALMDDFKAGAYPMPLVVADGRNPNEYIITDNATVYEVNPWEFGSFDPTVYAFAPLQYLGSRFVNGTVADNASCVRGFDNAGFIMGSSSTLFNEFLLDINTTSIPTILKEALTDILDDLGERNDDIAIYSPNPFYDYRDSSETYATTKDLNVVDGGEDGENIPLQPLIQPERAVDVIFAIDSSADTDYYWPNGTSLVATYERSLDRTGIANGTAFPAIPDQNTFVNLGLNSRPSFFGCDPKNISGKAPLVIYLPNSPYTYDSNFSTFTLTYTDEERDSVITNGWNVVTRGNGTVDENFPQCVACAILQRSTYRTNTSLPTICTTCFTDYCWNGTLNSTDPREYNPSILIASSGALKTVADYSVVVLASVLALFWAL